MMLLPSDKLTRVLSQLCAFFVFSKQHPQKHGISSTCVIEIKTKYYLLRIRNIKDIYILWIFF